eukprot:TRINITY_DN3964_c0_g1_i3.p1 TRINITY_DN3964_c0_g1~~TRINITY_DN3964_c0_g1_i3.p1  ORF type:complete len:317 (-),score=50.29 TRINITY_DN3964_c0_g1_i3:647-1597(-)
MTVLPSHASQQQSLQPQHHHNDSAAAAAAAMRRHNKYNRHHHHNHHQQHPQQQYFHKQRSQASFAAATQPEVAASALAESDTSAARSRCVRVTRQMIYSLEGDAHQVRYVLGQTLYPMVRDTLMCSPGLAGKLTGMLLELSLDSLCNVLEDFELFKSAVSEALESLKLAGMILPIKTNQPLLLYTKDGQVSPADWQSRRTPCTRQQQLNHDPNFRRNAPCCRPVDVQTLFAAASNERVAQAVNLDHYRQHYYDAQKNNNASSNATRTEEYDDDDDEEEDESFEPGNYEQFHSYERRPVNRVPNNNVLLFFKQFQGS